MIRFADPKNDVAFRKIFGNEQHKEILISFLNAVLGLSGSYEIDDITILNPYQAPKIELLKESILDVRARNKLGVTFIVEMQVARLPHIRKRFTYYLSKTYASQIARGDDYPKLNQVIFIGILDFNEFEGEDFLTKHLLLNTSTFKQELKDLEFNFIELPKFNKKEVELVDILDKWIFFIKNAGDLAIAPNTEMEKALQSAYEVANQFTWTSDEMDAYELRGIRIQDERGARELAYREGRQEGIQEGRQEGIQEGRQEGRQEGERLAKLQIAQTLLANGMSLAEVARMIQWDLAALEAALV